MKMRTIDIVIVVDGVVIDSRLPFVAVVVVVINHGGSWF